MLRATRPFLASVVLYIFSNGAMAGPLCTDQDRSEWLTEAEIKNRITASGFTIDVFKITKGNCYEIYGRDTDGRRVEVYFHPVTGSIVEKHGIN